MRDTRLASKNSRLAQLLPGVYYTLERTDKWEVRTATDQTLNLFGYTTDEIISMSGSFPEVIIYAEDLEMVHGKKREATNENQLYELEYRIRTKAGAILYAIDKYTVYRNEGNVLVMEGYISEIQHLTNRDRLFHQLQAYRNAVDVNMISSITDKSGKIIYANENFRRISKYEMSELIGQNHRVVNSGTHDKSFFKDLWRTIASGKSWHGELRNRAKDGSLYWVDTVIIPIFNQKKEIDSYLSLRTLIDDRKEAEERKQTYTSMLEQLAFMVAHDVRGPLCSILGLTDLLLNYKNTNNEHRQGLAYLNRAAVNLDKVTHKLTQFVNDHDLPLQPGDPASKSND